MKKIITVILVICLTLWVCASAFAESATNIDLNNGTSSTQDLSSNGFSGFIDTYHPTTSNVYQSGNDLQLNLSYGHGGPGGHGGHGGYGGHGGPGGPGFGPDLWVYTLIGIIVVGLSTR